MALLSQETFVGARTDPLPPLGADSPNRPYVIPMVPIVAAISRHHYPAIPTAASGPGDRSMRTADKAERQVILRCRALGIRAALPINADAVSRCVTAAYSM